MRIPILHEALSPQPGGAAIYFWTVFAVPPLAPAPVPIDLDAGPDSASAELSEPETSALIAGIAQLGEGVVLLELGAAQAAPRICYANAAFSEALGFHDRPRALLGQALTQVLPGDVQSRLCELANCTTQNPLRFSVAHPGGPRSFALRLSPVRESRGKPARAFGFLREVTAQPGDGRSELDRERLAVAARLAAGLLHEVNNPLASVTTNLEWLAAALPGLGATTGPVHLRSQNLATVSAALVDALTGAERVEASIENLSLLSGINYSGRDHLDLRVLLDAVLAELQPMLDGVRIERDYADEVPLVYASERRLRQAFANLVLNAAQALERVTGPRVITLRVGGSDRLLVEIQDSGPGISAEHQRQLFDPFFSTKPAGIGKGIGLYLARTIVEANGGTIGFVPAPSSGALFRIELPKSGPTP